MIEPTIEQLENALARSTDASTEWHSILLVVASKHCMGGHFEAAQQCAERVDEAKLPDELKNNYHLLLATLAEKKGDVAEIIASLKRARSADRASLKPQQQFSLTKQIAIVLDSNQQLDEAIAEWKLLIDDLKNFEHSEHQPLLAHKFLAQTLQKNGQNDEASAVKQKWCDEHIEIILARHAAAIQYQSSKAPDSYEDELSNYFERCRQNVYRIYGEHPELIERLKRRNAEFWVGVDSMRIKMADLRDMKNEESLSDSEQLPYFFYMRTISTYLTATELAAGGRIPEAFGALRMCMENSLYAFHLFEKPSDAELWLDRPILALGEISAEKRAKRTKIGTTFGPSKLINDVLAKSELVGQTCRYYYEMSIDEGAHPNVDVFRNQASQRYEGDAYIFGLDFLNPLSSVQCCETILSASKAVIDVFKLAEWIW